MWFNRIVHFVSCVEGLDFLKDTAEDNEKGKTGGASASNDIKSSNSGKKGVQSQIEHSGKKGGWGSEEQEDQTIVDRRLQRSSIDMKGGGSHMEEEDEEDDCIPVIPTLG